MAGVWREVLAQVGVAVDAVDVDHVRIWDDEAERTVFVREVPYRLSESQIPDPPPEPSLLVLPRASARAISAATRRGWFVVTDAGAVTLQLGRRRIDRPANARPATQPARRTGPPPRALFTLVRRMLAAPAAPQTALAERSGVSQSRVSKVLTTLAGQGLVHRTEHGWDAVSRPTLLSWWLGHYPGPGGTTSYWMSVDDILPQTTAALSLLNRAHPNAQPVVSGDAAADLLAPWHRPSRSVVYTHAATSLEPAGFVPVSDSTEASLIVVAPADPGVWLPHPWLVPCGDQTVTIADPLQIMFDMQRSGATDADEAVGQLWTRLQGPLSQTWRASVAGSPVVGSHV